ncbi:Clp protease [Nonomuraea sp. NN258]|uniref:Clp protease N-terminal domain-containing protein n=1 Tax=Nonomuraea antri TaxID=2730852 RepID=UPI0015680CDB|nr:Clp protease N-terminal domain-containing protein [Nonomuraea antri]NRQ37396.1 Clp protease [Nonomuraea antri]
MNAFDMYLHTILTQGDYEARKDGSATVEAHHLLLAVAGYEGTPEQRVLAEAGLDQEGVRAALDREFDRSLAVAGVSRAAFDLPRPSVDSTRHPGMGASAKLALERGFASAPRKKDLRPPHVLLGILQSEVGTVPRALELAGVDRAELTGRVRELLVGQDG